MSYASGFLLLATSVIASAAGPSEYLVYAGTYTHAANRGIYAYRFQTATGKLSPIGLAAAMPGTSFFLVAHPNHRFLYSADADGHAVSAFAMDTRTGKLTPLNQVETGDGPCHLVVDGTGRWLAVANYNDGTMALLPIHPDGSLGGPAAVERHSGKGANRERQEGPHAHGVYWTPDNRFLLVTDLGLDKIFIYKFDAARGILAANHPPYAGVAAGAGPRHLAFHPNGRIVYAISELANTITGFHFDPAAGALDSFQTVSTLPADAHGTTYAAEAVVNRGGTRLYASNRGHESIAVFSIEGAGRLVAAGHVPSEGKFPADLALDPGGNYLLVTNQDTDGIAIFRVDPKSGELALAGAPVTNAPKPVCLLFVPAR